MQKTRKTVIFAAFVFYARRLTSFILTVISYRGRQKKWDFLYRVSQQILELNLAKNRKFTKDEKFVKVC